MGWLFKRGFYPALFAKSRLKAINYGQGFPLEPENATTMLLVHDVPAQVAVRFLPV
jgi:hypothetical protein